MPRPSAFDTHQVDILVPGVALPIAGQELSLWDSTRVKPGEDLMDQATAADTYVASCMHVKGVLVFVSPTTQGVTVKLYWKIGGTWVVVNNTGSGETVAAAARYFKVLPCGGTDTKITILAGGTAPSALLSSARLRDNANAITVP